MRKIYKIIALSLMISLLFGTVAMAQVGNQCDEVKVNDVVVDSDGCKAVVISVSDNGSYVTLKQQLAINAKKNCNHTSIVAYGNPKSCTKDTSIADSTYCYRWKSVYNGKCSKCGQKGFEIIQYGKKIKHKYGFFTKKCSECGRKK